jgi:protein SCO1/2
VCPLTIGKIEGILPKIPEARVLLVSLDPSRDDPAALSRLKADHGLDDRWTLARPSEDGVREIAAALGVKYRKAASGEINHSAVVALLDARGVPLARIDGLNAPDSVLVDASRR